MGHVTVCIERQKVAEVDRQAGGEGGRTGGEVRIGQLELRVFLAQQLDHRTRLKPFADRRRVHPEERPVPIAGRRAPGGIARADAAAAAQRPGDLVLAVRRYPRERTREVAGRGVPRAEERPHAGQRGDVCGWLSRRASMTSIVRRKASIGWAPESDMVREPSPAALSGTIRKLGVARTPLCTARW